MKLAVIKNCIILMQSKNLQETSKSILTFSRNYTLVKAEIRYIKLLLKKFFFLNKCEECTDHYENKMLYS